MNETQQLIKTQIEQNVKQEFGIDVVVEYVSDVNERSLEIENQYQIKFNSVYETDKLAGAFLPSVGHNPYYILVQESRNDMLDVMTVFHEYRHLLDYLDFIHTVFDNDVEKMKHSQLYVTFNVYSEFSATRSGVLNYLKIVSVEGMNQNELCEILLKEAEVAYQNLEGIVNRYHLLVHSLRYLGYVIPCVIYLENINFKQIVDNMELSDELKPVIAHILSYENKYDWYEISDKLMRNFVDGGIA